MDNIFVVWTADLRKSDYVVPTPKDLWCYYFRNKVLIWNSVNEN